MRLSKDFIANLGCAVTTGILVAIAFPPYDIDWVVFFALVPLLWVISECKNGKHAFLCGMVSGIIAAFFFAKFLTSASTWTGWANLSNEEFLVYRSRHWWFLFSLYMLAVFFLGGAFWGLFSLVLQKLKHHSGLALLFIIPLLWILIPEWTRIKCGWDIEIGFLGGVVADYSWIRQIAALGGTSLISGFVVLCNVGIFSLLKIKQSQYGWKVPLTAFCIVIFVCLYGSYRIRLLNKGPMHNVGVAVIQYHQPVSYKQDFLKLGIDRYYLALIGKSIKKLDGKPLELLVLPESIGVGAISLDGTRARFFQKKPHAHINDWKNALQAQLGKSNVLLIHGFETVKNEQQFNSMLMWSKNDLVGLYNKRRLVPFAEYQPKLLETFGIRGVSQFVHGKGSKIVTFNNYNIGAFICQEVLIPSVIRQSVNEGAQLLVTGGNDGVFGSPAAAEVFSDIAQLRAVETGRYLIRAMKTGVSAIIDPSGKELKRIPVGESRLTYTQVTPKSDITLYNRFGNWIITFAFIITCILLLYRIKK